MILPCLDIHTHDKSRIDAIINIYPNEQLIEGAYHSVGIHPWHTVDIDSSTIEKLSTLTAHPQVVAIGETGLDALKGASIEKQIEIFKLHVSLSEKYQKPLIIHCVKCFNDIIELKKTLHSTMPWIIHGFRGKKEVAEMLLKAGCYLSFGSSFQETALSAVPLNRLFIETDDTVEKIEGLYQRIATVRGEALEELAQGVKKNVKEVFFKA